MLPRIQLHLIDNKTPSHSVDVQVIKSYLLVETRNSLMMIALLVN